MWTSLEKHHRLSDGVRRSGATPATAYKWLRRYRAEGAGGLLDRSSRPLHCPHRTDEATERQILKTRRIHRRGAQWIGDELGIAASTVGRVLARHQMPLLRDLDALTGDPVRRGPISRVRYERARPGELIHIDVKKLGRIPEGGGWRAHGRGPKPVINRAQGYDYVHSAIDDHSRLAYAEIHPDERGETCAAFIERAARFFGSMGITRIERVMSDNALNYRRSSAFQDVLGEMGARHVLIRPHCPWTNGKVERLNRTLLREWAYSQVFTSNAERAACLPEWLWHYNTRRRHSSLGGLPPISRLSTTW
ncbi:IS481 family transposase [Miltoncostaea oceani]|uniref:IS481 family transposase n=1 Tax=Miltoncostaea oceani TaxID=2843216 RepID=UPI003CCEEF69